MLTTLVTAPSTVSSGVAAGTAAAVRITQIASAFPRAQFFP
jgi:hypothetical protein